MKKYILNPEWITDKFIYIMLGIFPLWIGFEGYSNITASKFAFFISASLVWIILLTISIITQHKKFKPDFTDIIILAFLLCATVSSLCSQYGLITLIGAGRYDGLLSFALYLLIFIGSRHFAKPKRDYLTAISISISICCILCIIQLLGYNPFHLFPNDCTYYDHGIKFSSEILGTIGNVDVFGTLLSIFIPTVLCHCMLSREKKDLYYLIPAGLAFFITVKIDVSSLKVALVFSLVIFIIIMVKNRNFIKGFAIIILMIAVAYSSSFINFSTDGVNFGRIEEVQSENEEESTIYQIKQILSGHIEDSYGTGRIGIWRQLLETFDQNPIIGTGQGTVSERVDIEYSREVEETGKIMKTHVDNAHNEYLGYLMDDGIIGLLLYLILIITTIIQAFKSKSIMKQTILCGLNGYWIQSFFGLGLCLVLPVIWLSWGICNCKTEKIYD